MIVVVANHIPPAVRGRMKLWFVEPRPNVFVSGIKDSTADKVISYLMECCPPSSGIMIFQRITKAPGYKIYTLGLTNKDIISISGLQLILEKIISPNESDKNLKK